MTGQAYRRRPSVNYQWFKQRLILSVSKPSISQRSQIKEDTVEPSVAKTFCDNGDCDGGDDAACVGDAGSAYCGPNEWLCVPSQQCINISQVCDRVSHCANGADESANCSTQPSLRL